MKPPTTLLIPVHNRREITLGCLHHLQNLGDLGKFEVIILDDGSTDGTSTAIDAEFPHVHIMRGPGDWWWTGAIKVGMQHAAENDANIVIWLNDDCRPEPGALERLERAVGDDPEAVAVAAAIDASGETIPTGFIGRTEVSAAIGQSINIHGGSGYAVAIGRPTWMKIGFPDSTKFPHYAGDTEYTLRASRAGSRVRLLGDAQVTLEPGHDHPGWIDRLDHQAGWVMWWCTAFKHPGSSWRITTDWHLSLLKYGMIFGPVVWARHTFERHFQWLSILRVHRK